MPKSSETNTQSPFSKKFKVRDLAYMAGLVDGEGCITGTYKTRWPQARVQVSNKQKILVDWCQEIFGGYIYTKTPKKLEHAITYEWSCPAEYIIPFLKLIIPHLKIKKQQAYLCMALRHGIIQQQKRERLDHLITKLHDLNKKGR